MAKGVFTQSSCVLLSAPVSLDVLSNLLCSFPLLKVGSPQRKDWVGGGDYVLIEMDKKKRGMLLVDIVDQPWPDAGGDPQRSPDLFAAWGMGYFGPFAVPGAGAGGAVLFAVSLAGGEGAGASCVYPVADELCAGGGGGRGAGGAGKDVPFLPDGYSYKSEMMLMGQVIDRLLMLPEAICYFNPNGETLLTRAAARERAEMFMKKRLPPLELWCNVRRFSPGVEGWTLMDIVGMEQIDLPDSEVFATGRYPPTDLAAFLVNTSVLLATKHPELREGSLLKGPGGLWRMRIGDAKAPPARRVFKWFPEGVALPGGLGG